MAKNKTQLALEWFKRSLLHLEICMEKNCEWFHNFKDFIDEEKIHPDQIEKWIYESLEYPPSFVDSVDFDTNIKRKEMP